MEPLTVAPPPKPSKAQIILRKVLYAVMALGIGFALLFLYWSVQSPTVLTVKNSPFPVRPPIVAQEDVIYVKVNYCKHTDTHGQVVARLVGKRSIIRLPYSNDTQIAGCVDRELPVPIPAYAGDDVYHFEFEATYQINPIKKQHVTMRSQEFTVQAEQ